MLDYFSWSVNFPTSPAEQSLVSSILYPALAKLSPYPYQHLLQKNAHHRYESLDINYFITPLHERLYAAWGGRAIRQMGLKNLLDFMGSFWLLVEAGYAQVTRLDVYQETGKFTPEDMDHWIESGYYVGHFKFWELKAPKNLSTLEHLPKTLYFGKRGGNTFVRFYDQSFKDESEYTPETRYRFEVEHRGDYARKLFTALIQTPYDEWDVIFSSVINRAVSFRDPLSDSNTTRKKLLPLWAEFLGSFKKITFWEPPPKKTFDEKLENFTKQYSGFISFVAEYSNRSAVVPFFRTLSKIAIWGQSHLSKSKYRQYLDELPDATQNLHEYLGLYTY